MSAPLPGSKNGYALKKLRYSHDAMIDAIIEDPSLKQYQLAQIFGVTKEWVSMLMCSDAFQARLAARKADIVDPELAASFKQRLEVLGLRSMNVLMEKLADPDCHPNTAIQALTISAKAAGLGGGAQVNVDARTQTQFVVAMPGKAQSSMEWAQAYGAKGMEAGNQSALDMAVPPPPPGIEMLATASVCEPMDVEQPMRPVGE